jgi:lipid II:glycine glycyltransferase (peptidoglycan interpeptide bridge formation enzyme)
MMTPITFECAGLQATLNPTGFDPHWDAFVTTLPGTSIEQTTGFAQAKSGEGWQAWLLKISNPGGLVGGAVILQRRMGLGLSVLYLARGPVCAADPALVPSIVQTVDAAAARLRGAYCVIVPAFNTPRLEGQFEALGWRNKPEAIPPSGLVVATLLLDLRPEPSTLLAQMRSSTRQSIRKSLAFDFRLEEVGVDSVPQFYDLMCQLCSRRGTTPHPPSSRPFTEQLRWLGPQGNARLFLGRLAGEVITGAFVYTVGRTFSVAKVGWSGGHKESNPNHRMWWELILWARSRGFETFDFLQIIPEHARALQQGQQVNDSYWGVTQFKVGFGGKLEFSGPPLYMVHTPVLRHIHALGLHRVIESRWVQQYARRRYANQTREQ